MAFNLSFTVKNEGLLKVTGSHFKSGIGRVSYIRIYVISVSGEKDRLSTGVNATFNASCYS